MGAVAETTTGTPLERFVGSLAVTVFSGCYYYALLWLPTGLALSFSGFRTVGAAVLVPYVLSAILPHKGFPKLLSSWFFRCALKLHDYEEVSPV